MKEIFSLILTIIEVKPTLAMNNEFDIEHAQWMIQASFRFSPLVHWGTVEPYRHYYYAVNSFNPAKKCGQIALFRRESLFRVVLFDRVILCRRINNPRQIANPLHKPGEFSSAVSFPPLAIIKYNYIETDHKYLNKEKNDYLS